MTAPKEPKTEEQKLKKRIKRLENKVGGQEVLIWCCLGFATLALIAPRGKAERE